MSTISSARKHCTALFISGFVYTKNSDFRLNSLSGPVTPPLRKIEFLVKGIMGHFFVIQSIFPYHQAKFQLCTILF